MSRYPKADAELARILESLTEARSERARVLQCTDKLRDFKSRLEAEIMALGEQLDQANATE